MQFQSPIWLLLLIVVAVLLIVYVTVQLRRKRYVARFSNVELLGSVAPRRPGWRRHLTFSFVLLALALLTVGIAEPTAAVQVPRERATVVLAVDVSLSMEATDVLPTRIQAAKTAAKKFADLLPKRINLGLVDFGGNASVLVAPTLDRAAVKFAIGKMHLEDSTAIGEAIFTSLQAIKVFDQATTPHGSKPAPARIVLLSDGTNTVGRPISEAIRAARAAKVPVSTIAFGTPTGTVNYHGQTIPVPADRAALSQIAAETGGSFHTAASVAELEQVYSNIGSQIGYSTEQRVVLWRWMAAGLLMLFAAAGSSMLWAGRFA